jgi:hypothetical protein
MAVLLKFQMFQPSMTGADKSGQNQVAGELASPTTLPLHRSRSAQSSSVLHLVTLIAYVLHEMRLLQLLNVLYASKKNFFLYYKQIFILCMLLKLFCSFKTGYFVSSCNQIGVLH